MRYTYRPSGVCSTSIALEIEGDTVRSVQFQNGCPGNAQGVAALAKDMRVDEVIGRLEGIRCGFKNTSCPDQLAKALKACRDSGGGR